MYVCMCLVILYLLFQSPPPKLEGDFSDTFKDFVACCLKKSADEVRVAHPCYCTVDSWLFENNIVPAAICE